MSLVSLLTGDDRAFDFEHAMAHRGLLGGLAPLDRFSATTYLMDPVKDVERRASFWHMNHQLLHNDFTDVVNLSPNPILVDSDLSDQTSLTWWVFANNISHYAANDLAPP